MEDKELVCVDCQDTFIFTARDQEFYSEKGFKAPKRCHKCRVTKKARFEKQDSRAGEETFDGRESY